MNANQIVNMVVRLVIRKLVNKGVSAGVNAVGNRSTGGKDGETKVAGAPENSKRMKQTVKMMRRQR